MFTNLRSYLPFFIIIAASLMLALVGFVTGLSDFNARQEAAATATATLPPEVVSGLPTAIPRPTSPPLRPPQDALTVALSGEMANGGYWSWQDIVNLLGVYGTAGQMQSATIGDTTYSGVPFSYLLRYARVNGEADRILLGSRDGRQSFYTMRSVDEFANYLIAALPNNTLAFVPPTRHPVNVLTGLTSVQALRAEDARNIRGAPLPAIPSTLELTGSVQRGGQWTWADLTGLLGIYGQPGVLETVTVNGIDYAGVPAAYLFRYAEVTRERVNTIMLYTRSATEHYTFRELLTCTNCVIARAADNTLTLVQPGRDPEILPELAVIHIP